MKRTIPSTCNMIREHLYNNKYLINDYDFTVFVETVVHEINNDIKNNKDEIINLLSCSNREQET